MRRFTISATIAVAVLAAVAFAQQPQSAAGLLKEFFAAVNSDDPEALVEFYKEGVTEDFRTRRTAEEDRAFYRRVRDDLGALTVEGLRRVAPDKALAMVNAEKTDMPVEFAFDLAGGKIDGFSVRVGGPPGGRDAMVQLPDEASPEEFAATLDRQLKRLAATDRFSGVVLLARDGEPVFHRAYGKAEREAGRAVTTATAFDVGSITKMITKVAIAQLAQAGKLGLSDAVSEHLPDYPNSEVAKMITIQQLVDHSSGLGDIFNQRWVEADKSKFVQPDDFFSLFADEPLQFTPGEKRSYSNAGYITLGAVVSAASGRPYFDYVEERIFRPAGMSDSGFPVKDGSDVSLAIGYTRGGPTGGHADATGPLESNLGMLPIRGCPAGSSTHTASDLLKLDSALRAGKLADPEWTAWVFGSVSVRETSDYGIGVAGGGPGVSAGWEGNGGATAIVLANLDPPAGSGLVLELFRAIR
ncbi:MAG: serine hydrolase [Thermoanaerobaculia bacterium]